MKNFIININSFLKGVILFLRPGVFLNFLSNPLLFASNVLKLTKWISVHNDKNILNDFYRPVRNYADRYKLFNYIIKQEKLETEVINYLEFGVSKADSFKWWLKANSNTDSRFYGFDTFEGLPEKWGTYKKGDMSALVPDLNETRHDFFKGLFQDTLYEFIKTHDLNEGKRKIIHLDADLFSSTIFVLSSLAPYLNNNDILLFDEFNVPNHEFYAFKIFTDTFYIKYELLGAVNNFYQVAFKIVK
ncbi:MAG: hypothetical protein IPL53_02195 [Ignavibacteria bacterium]|nr:hypothetical protein [Ignavibacteria bacterium]